MKPYGVPRTLFTEAPDCADGKEFAMKASRVNLPGKGGVTRSNFKNAAAKQQTRRGFAKAARASLRKDCLNDQMV